jgi:hypothetical protein
MLANCGTFSGRTHSSLRLVNISNIGMSSGTPMKVAVAPPVARRQALRLQLATKLGSVSNSNLKCIDNST